MRARTFNCRTASRCSSPAVDSADAQSTACPRRTASASSSRGSYSLATGHLLGKTDHGALRRLVCGACRRLLEQAGDLLVGVAELNPEDDHFPFLRSKAPEGALVALDFF